jgi:hypothetical protein
MMRFNFIKLLVAVATAGLLSGCFSINNFQSAKTLEKRETELGIGLAAGSTFDLEGEDVDTIGGVIKRGNAVSDLVLYGRYGITDRFDLGLRLSSLGDIGLDFKYMAIGTQDSEFAFSPGLGVSSNLYFLGLSRMFQLEVPLHFSYNFTDNFLVYITPRYVGQTSSFVIFENESWIDYAGGSLGFEIGKDIIFSVGLNYIRALNYSNYSSFNVGAGIRFRFGGVKSK